MKKLIVITGVAITFLLLALLIKPQTPESEPVKQTEVKATPTPVPTATPTPTPTPNPILEAIETSPITVEYTFMEMEYICDGYITAYSDKETYCRTTASGAEVHYSDDPYEPTTVAIDRKYFSFGELFWIDTGDGGRLYVAEDTGGAVKGYHWDVYRESLEEVNGFPTGRYPVYRVTYVTTTKTINDEMN